MKDSKWEELKEYVESLFKGYITQQQLSIYIGLRDEIKRLESKYKQEDENIKEALEKQIEKDAIPFDGDIYYRCPTCGECELEPNCEDYCPRCGQKLKY